MEKVMIIGCCGAGKSTFAKKLHAITGLELIHLDTLYWKPNWEETKKEEWERIVEKLCVKQQWIIDGNYGGTMAIRFAHADTIVFLDYPTVTCLWRITKRTLQYKNKTRSDMAIGCQERFDWNFYHYVATYNLKRRKKILVQLAKISDEKKVIIFQKDKNATLFLQNLSEAERIN